MTQLATTELDLLAAAVARNATVRLALPSAGLERNFRTRFVAELAEGILVEVASGSLALLEELIRNQSAAQASFHSQGQWLSFQSKPLRIENDFQLNADTSINVVLLERPQNVRAVQRRSVYRVTVYEESQLVVRAWVIPEQVPVGDRPLASQEVRLAVRDIGMGGMGVNVLAPQSPRNPKSLVPDQRLRVQLQYGTDEMVLDARFRPAVKDADSAAPLAGVMFKKLESNIEGRKALATLTRIVSQLQREEIRRKRLGV
jgi:c-di-GMP-binding flagellar brake protein YcgR